MATNDSKIREAQRRIDDATQALNEAREALRKASVHLDVAQPECQVITFKLRHDRGGKEYSYAALNTGGRWFTTGSTCPKNGYRWSELLELINGADALIGGVAQYNKYDLPF